MSEVFGLAVYGLISVPACVNKKNLSGGVFIFRDHSAAHLKASAAI